nr:DUF4398 domain-containing protein [Methylomarinum sp. Ch1-1]MDP4519155.1 DUF4398 domain-containing protein [Methylomarinum sp. Ch1-1]
MKSNLFIQGTITILFVNMTLLSGCATEPLPALEEARQEVTQARNDPNVAENAPVALYDAEQSLKEADQLWEAQKDEDEVEHLAYLTKGKVAIAKYTAQRKVADDQLKVLENTRKKLILETRKNEVKEARKEVQSLEEQLKDLKAKKPIAA